MNNIKIIKLENIRVIAKVKTELTTTFEVVGMRLINFYLGLKVHKDFQK